MFHHLSAKHCTKIALVEVSGSERMMGSKPAACIWPLVSLVKTWYHEATWLVLPLAEKVGKACKRMKIEH